MYVKGDLKLDQSKQYIAHLFLGSRELRLELFIMKYQLRAFLLQVVEFACGGLFVTLNMLLNRVLDCCIPVFEIADFLLD